MAKDAQSSGQTALADGSSRMASRRLLSTVLTTNRLKDGRFDAEQRRVPGLSRFIEKEPRLIAFNE
jgi:hypothetical protein